MSYNIVFYKDRKGREPVKDFIDSLALASGKDARINMKNVSPEVSHT